MNMDTCRICYEPDNLECLCQCRGTIRFVHAECLEHWIQVSGKKKCELCGANFEMTNETLQEKTTKNTQVTDIDFRKICLCFSFVYIITCVIYLCTRL